jgi:hypothetical protein
VAVIVEFHTKVLAVVVPTVYATFDLAVVITII